MIGCLIPGPARGASSIRWLHSLREECRGRIDDQWREFASHQSSGRCRHWWDGNEALPRFDSLPQLTLFPKHTYSHALSILRVLPGFGMGPPCQMPPQVNGNGLLWVQVGAVGADSVLAQIMVTVANAQLRKPQIQAFADRLAAYFVPSVIVFALLTWIVWGAIAASRIHVGGNGGGFGGKGVKVDRTELLAFMFGCAVLVIACPCALGLATPTAVMVGSGVGASHGVLFKGGDVLEAASSVNTVLFDKTGTLTTGKLELGETIVWQGASELCTLPMHEGSSGAIPTGERREPSMLTAEQLLQLAASAERGSEHPIGNALCAAAKLRGLATAEPTDFESIPGHGLSCYVGGTRVRLGNRAFLRNHGYALTAEQEARVSPLEALGQTVVFVALSGGQDGAEAGGTTGRVSVRELEKEMREAKEALEEAEGGGMPRRMVQSLQKRVAVLEQQWQEFGAAAVADTPACAQDGRTGATVSEGANGSVAGALAVTDRLRPEAPGVILRLREAGLQVWMVSGDNERTARHLARCAGIDEHLVCAGMPPAGKSEQTRKLQQEEGRRVVVVGDGVNDAPALAQADVGMAVGSGTGVAIEAADVVLMRSSLVQVEHALTLARVVMRRIRLNFVWAFVFNVVGIPIAAGIFYGPWGIYLPVRAPSIAPAQLEPFACSPLITVSPPDQPGTLSTQLLAPLATPLAAHVCWHRHVALVGLCDWLIVAAAVPSPATIERHKPCASC